jgi:deoxyribodipyrimidine photo-lyase
MKTLVWFRNDLRLHDNPALAHAGAEIVPLYIIDDNDPRPLGGASRWWLHHSLSSLEKGLGGLVLRRGNVKEELDDIIMRHGIRRVVWNRVYDGYGRVRDTEIKKTLTERGIVVDTFNGTLIHEPWEVKNAAGEPYKVFTPFWRAAYVLPVRPLEKVARPDVAVTGISSISIESLHLLPDSYPHTPDWAAGFQTIWEPGEAGARKRLTHFLDTRVVGYKTGRNDLGDSHTSMLSPHLRFGEISPVEIVHATQERKRADPRYAADTENFLSELGWREFSYSLLYYFPELAKKNWKPAYDHFPWHGEADYQKLLRAWQKGVTGYPIVDAGMRELWRTGYMHNRARMITASFLIKHMRIDWREGEKWFWDTLVDADPANNPASWQWVFGSGADASPYFRIFNPIEQGKKFDKDGVYVRTWIPELANLETPYIHAPWTAPAASLERAGIRIGETYPPPIVDHATARRTALAAYQKTLHWA